MKCFVVGVILLQIVNGLINDLEYTEDESECLSDRKFLINGRCYGLLGKGPCAEGEWLVLDEFKRPFKAACRKKPCNTKEIWWTELERCIPKVWARKELCLGEQKTITINAFGHGKCVCYNQYGEMEDRDGCFEYYQRGPCDADEVVAYNRSSGFATCDKDKCLHENAKSESDRKLYAPLEVDGECYKIGEADPCDMIWNQSRFVIDYFAHVPRCSYHKWELILIDNPVLCRYDANKKCRDPVEVKNENRLTYLLQMKREAEALDKNNTIVDPMFPVTANITEMYQIYNESVDRNITVDANSTDDFISYETTTDIAYMNVTQKYMEQTTKLKIKANHTDNEIKLTANTTAIPFVAVQNKTNETKPPIKLIKRI